MAATYPIRLADQMREHLRSLRKARRLTQAQVGAGLGVSQARIAEIEANPGPVNFDQLLQLLAYLGCSVCLEVDAARALMARLGTMPVALAVTADQRNQVQRQLPDDFPAKTWDKISAGVREEAKRFLSELASGVDA